MNFAFWLSFTVFLAVAGIALEIALGVRKIKRLEETDPENAMAGNPPKVSIILSALNEANTIEPALESLLALSYPNLEIIAINDRSTDATPAILERMAQSHPVLRVVHIDQLPPGWLGKNHALHQGAERAAGDYLLFTDADVIFAPDAVDQAVAYCERHCVDHLALLFRVLAKTHLLRMLLLNFSIAFMARFKPWKVNTSPRHFLGIGGFNMVRGNVYRKTGGHAAIPMAVLDDLMLGKLIKTLGYRQHVLFGRELISIEWYPTTTAMIKGLEKNIFAAFDYRLSHLIVATFLMLMLRVWPWIGLFTTDGATRWCNAATLVAGLALYADLLRGYGWRYRCLVFAPFISVIELAMWWRGSLLVLLRGGIEWRGTRYTLQELRRALAGKQAD